ncbi:inositol monophosphatase family protein [Celerinatantimonas yamalensis]|uniref:Nus factor SuhB n=1 Tax=Celerinatantimonas yamalensis TaxID=559956 RepID=A0ABW9G9D6_9GAMM
MNNHNIQLREAALKNIILAAGETALAHFRARPAGQFTLKGDQDYLTEADSLVELQIHAAIHEQFSDDQIFGEETGEHSGNAAALWVIDPIDGTANFARGIAHFCIAIAFVLDGKTELGAIYNPATGELYQTRRGHYAKKNGQPLQVACPEALNCATFELGWSTRVSQQRYLDVMTQMLDQGANVRRGASGALALAWVAEGRVDGYIELHMNAWDCLAGLLLVSEAGGETGRYPENLEAIYSGGSILAACPIVAQTLSDICDIPLLKPAVALADERLPNGAKKHYPLPPISLIQADLPNLGVDLYISGSTGATDLALLQKHQITTVINCAVNLDIDWVKYPTEHVPPQLIRHGSGAIRYYKLGLIDGAGNPPELLYGGYQMMRAALLQQLPDKPSYRNREHGNILVHCRGGRSRSVILVALFLHLEYPQRYPTLDAAIALIRKRRQLHPNEWVEAPKPELRALAEHAIKMHQAMGNLPFSGPKSPEVGQ